MTKPTGNAAGRALTDSFDPEPVQLRDRQTRHPRPRPQRLDPPELSRGRAPAVRLSLFALWATKGNERGRHRPLFELATRQHGVVSTRQLDELGYSRSSAAKAREGRAAAPGPSRRLRGRARASDLARALHGRGACLRARRRQPSVGRLALGLLRRPAGDDPPDGADRAPGEARVRGSLRRLCRRRIDDGATASRSPPCRARCSTWPRLLSPGRLERVLERAEERGSFDLAADRRAARAHRRPPGARHACGGRLTIYRPTPPFTRSGLERRFLELVREAGLPAPAMNFVVGRLRARRLLGARSGSRSNSTSTRPTARALPSSATGCARTICC